MEGLAGFFAVGWLLAVAIRHYVFGEPWFRWR
jgi:hypothetical protein